MKLTVADVNFQKFRFSFESSNVTIGNKYSAVFLEVSDSFHLLLRTHLSDTQVRINITCLLFLQVRIVSVDKVVSLACNSHKRMTAFPGTTNLPSWAAVF